MPADARTMVAGGNLEDDSERRWATNWPLHLLVTGTALATVAISPDLPTALLAGGWVAGYAAAHWARVMRMLPGAGPVSVVLLSALALGLLHAADQGLHMFAAYMLVWVLLPSFRGGLIATLLLAAGMVAMLLLSGEGSGPTAQILVLATGAGSALFSIVISSWIWRSERLSYERQELAEDLAATVRALEATRAELSAADRARGAQEEATRFAAEIHDTLAQSFTSITMLAQAAHRSAPSAAPLLAQIETVARGGLAEARALIARSQQPLDLAASLDRLAADLTQRTGVRAVVEAGGWSPVTTRTEVVLLRTVQEALRNVERHARASEVRILLDRTETEALLEVIDDGDGFDPDLPTAGFGLTGMRARIETEGGRLQLDSRRGAGTALRAVLPSTPGATASPEPVVVPHPTEREASHVD